MNGIERYYYKRFVTPKWADTRAIAKLYRASKNLGADWHVDHIVPLFHPRVCGLHCEDNLDIITCAANLKKGNWWWPDMWMEPMELELPCMREHQMKLL